MADNPGLISSTIASRDYTPKKFNSLMDFLKQGLQQGADASNEGAKISADRQNLATKGHQEMAQIGAKGDQERQNIASKSQADQETGDHAMHTAGQTMQDMYGTDNLADAQRKATAAGQSLHLGKDSLAVGQNELMKVRGQESAQDMHAAQQAYGMYNKELPRLQTAAQPILQGLGAVSDPKNVTNLGAAKAAMLRAYGLTRFNDAESNAQISPSVKAMLAKWQNAAGSDADTLTDPQRRDVMNTLIGGLQDIKNNHGQVIQSALNTYQGMSPTGGRGEILRNNLGSDGFGSSIGDAINKFTPMQQAAAQASADPNAGGLVKKVGGAGSSIANFLTGSKPPSANPGTATVQAPPKASGLQALFGGSAPAGAAPKAPQVGPSGPGANASPPPGLTFQQFQEWKRANSGGQ